MAAETVTSVTENPYGVTLLVVVLSVLAGIVMNYVVVGYLRRYTNTTETDYDNIVVSNLHIPLVITVSLVGFAVLTSIPSVTEETFLTQDQVSTFVGKPVISVILVVWAFYLNRVVNRIVKKINDEGKASDDRGRTYEFAPVFSNIWTLIVIVGSAGSLLVLWDYNISPLLGAAGIAGIALGIAAKETVGNFLGGLSLYVDDTYTIGDYLELDTGEAGTVVAVGVRSTTLRTRDNIQITVPNSLLNEERVINRSAPYEDTRLKIEVGVAYGTDIDEAENILTEIAQEEPLTLSNPAPKTRLIEFGDSSLVYELLCWVTRPEQSKRAKHEINREIYKRFSKEGIEIPYNKHDVNVYERTKTETPDE